MSMLALALILAPVWIDAHPLIWCVLYVGLWVAMVARWELGHRRARVRREKVPRVQVRLPGLGHAG